MTNTENTIIAARTAALDAQARIATARFHGTAADVADAIVAFNAARDTLRAACAAAANA